MTARDEPTLRDALFTIAAQRRLWEQQKDLDREALVAAARVMFAETHDAQIGDKDPLIATTEAGVYKLDALSDAEVIDFMLDLWEKRRDERENEEGD